MKRLIVGIVLILVAIVFVRTVRSTEDKIVDKKENPFAGMMVRAYVGSTNEGIVILDAELKEIGGRLMLIGTGVETGLKGNWSGGIQNGIAWDSVGRFYVLTKEQYESRNTTIPKPKD